MRFTCPVDGALNDVPELVTSFCFPEDLRETIDLLEGRLNCVVCPACKKATAMLTPVMVLDKDGKTTLLVRPKGISWEPEPELLAEVEAAGYRVENVSDYNALRSKIIERLDRYLKPVGPVILPSKDAPLSRSECIKRMSPLVLRLFKSRIDGFLPPLFQFSGNASPEVLARLERKMYVPIVCDQLQRILQEAARESKALSLFDQVKELVPKECLTDEVLQAETEKCHAYVAPDENPREFSGSYMQELLNAVVQACAGKLNPRGKEMAVFLISAWIFERRADVQIDSQFLLSADLVQRIVRFEDLWDAWMAREKELTKEFLDKVYKMLENYGFADRLAETLHGKFMWVGQPQDGKPIDSSEFAAAFEETLLEKVLFNKSHKESADGGVLVEGAMRMLLQNGQQEAALRFADAVVAKAHAAGDEIAAVSMAAHATDVLNEFQIVDEATRMIAGAVAGEHEHATWGPSLFVYVYTVLGNTMRYTFQYKEALATYNLALRCVDTIPDAHEQEGSRAVLERNIGIVYRDMGRYREALELLQNAEKRDPEDHRNQFSLAIFYQLINRYPEVLRYLNRAIEKAHGGINAPVRGNYLLGRGLLKRSLGDSDGGVEDLREAYNLLPTDGMKVRAAAATLRCQPSTEQGKSSSRAVGPQ